MGKEKNINYLSYSISNSTPLYGNAQGIKISPYKEIRKGDTCNTMKLSFPNHIGTHIDLPYHFNNNGKKINDYPPSFWQFNFVECVDLTDKVSDGQMIDFSLFNGVENNNLDMLLIKTGYGIFRGTDRYTLTPPGISSELAHFLRKNFSQLRCIGIDLISVTSYYNRKEGRLAHQAFLNPNEGEPILLIEDMKLDTIGPFKKVVVAPLLIENADGAPCTIFAYK